MLRRRSLVAFAITLNLLLAFTVSAQAPTEKVDAEVVAKLKEEGTKRSQVMQIISYMTDVHGPRLTGSPQLRAASEWAKTKLTEWGLESARLEPWGPFGRGWSLQEFTANVVEPTFWPLIAYPKAWSPSTDGVVRGPVVYLDATKEEDLEKFKGKLKGAIVLLSPPREVKALFEAPGQRQTDQQLLQLANADPSLPREPGGPGGPGRNFQMTPEQRAAFQMQGRKWRFVSEGGAAVVLEPGRGDGGTLFVQSVTMPQPADPAGAPGSPFLRGGPRPWAKDAPATVPQAVVAAEHYNRLIRMVQKNVPVILAVAIKSRFHDDDLMGYNVIAEIPGGDLKDEIVMLGAHFDSWHAGTGATDNAAGSGVCMEAVRILQAVGTKPRRTVRIGLWTGEEQGLLGSRAHVSNTYGRRLDAQPFGEGRRGSAEASGDRSGGEGGARTPRAPAKYELLPAHASFAAYFNLDNGTGKVRGIHLQGNEACRPIFRAWLAPFRDTGATTITLTNTGGTDHLSFDGVGLPGFQFIQDPIEYETRTHHSNMDVYERIQEEDMKQAAVIMASFVYNAATRDEKLPRKPLQGEVVSPGQATE